MLGGVGQVGNQVCGTDVSCVAPGQGSRGWAWSCPGCCCVPKTQAQPGSFPSPSSPSLLQLLWPLFPALAQLSEGNSPFSWVFLSILSCNEVELQWAQWAVCEIAASPISDPSAGDTCDPLLSTWDGMFLCWEHAVVEAHRLEVLSISSALAVCSALLPAQHQSVPTGTHTWALGCFAL